MGKSKKKSQGKSREPRKVSAEKKQGRSWTGIVLLGLAAIGLGGGYSLYRAAGPQKAGPEGDLRAETRKSAGTWTFVERRPVLPAGLFVGRVRQAYAMAARIPEVLDRLYCYCRCKEGHGHKTLLTCYTVTHAST